MLSLTHISLWLLGARRHYRNVLWCPKGNAVYITGCLGRRIYGSNPQSKTKLLYPGQTDLFTIGIIRCVISMTLVEITMV